MDNPAPLVGAHPEIYVFGHNPAAFGEEERFHGWPFEARFRFWIGYQVLSEYEGRYRTQTRPSAHIIVLSHMGMAHGHFEVNGSEEPNDRDRESFADVTNVYRVTASALYRQPVNLHERLDIRVRPGGVPINVVAFHNILALAGGYWETRPRT